MSFIALREKFIIVGILRCVEYTGKEIKDNWYEFFSRSDYGKMLFGIYDRYPTQRSIYVDYDHILDFDKKFANELLNYPEEYIKNGEKAIRDYIGEKEIAIHLRIKNLPDDTRKLVKELRSVDLGKFIAIEGIIRRATEVRPKLKTGAFECSDCGEINYVAQDGIRLKEPDKCAGCGKPRGKVKFILRQDLSIFVDTQKIEIQEMPKESRAGEQPQRLMAYIEDDIAGIVVPGDRIVINGILRAQERRIMGNIRSTEFHIFLDVNSIEKEDKDIDIGELTPEQEEEIKEFARKENVIDVMRDSLAPTIYGMDIEKEALVLQMFGGVRKVMRDGTRIRGDIHILLVGDPGTAKSQFLQRIADLAPRGIYTSGKASSAAGLTATAVKDETGRWTLEAGALVLADMGHASIDEIDKMSSTDRDSMYQAMEQQIISVSKAGIYATLMARCSILGAANPKYGRFDRTKLLVEQIDLPTPLLSRFDVIFKVLDIPEPKKDKAMAEHILNVHLTGEMLELGEDVLLTNRKLVEPQFFKRYVSYAKRIIPKLSDEAMKEIENEYLQTRKQYEKTGAVPITPRQLEAMVRLAEASARARLSDVVTREDALRAIRIVRYFLKEASTEEGIQDVDIVTVGRSAKQRSMMSIIDDIITELENDKGYALEDEIIKMAEEEGVKDERKIAKLLKDMSTKGWLYSPREGVYKHANK